MTMARPRASATAEADAQAAEADAQDATDEAATDAEAAADAEAVTYEPSDEGAILTAEEVLAEHAKMHPPELLAAQLTKADPEAEIDLGTIETLNEDDEVVAASKHGDALIYVAKTADGVLYKSVVDAETGKPPEPPPEEPAANGSTEESG